MVNVITSIQAAQSAATRVRDWPVWSQVALAVGAVVLTLGGRKLVEHWFDDRLTYAAVFGVLMPLVVLVRPAPFLAAAMVGCVGVLYLFEVPQFSFAFNRASDVIEFLVFIAAAGVAALTAWLSQRADQARHASDALLRSFVDESPMCKCVTTPEGRIVYANASLSRLWRRPLDELIGRSIGDVLPEHAVTATLQQIRLVHESRQVHTSTEEFPPSEVGQSPQLLEWRRFALVIGPQSLIGASANDLTERVRAQTALREAEARRSEALAAALDQRTIEVRQAEKALARASRLAAVGSMAYGLAEDLKNVLQPFSHRIDNLLALREMPADARADLIVAVALIDHLRQMARNLELFARDPEQEGSEGTTHLGPWIRRVQGLLETSLDASRRENDRWTRLKTAIPDDLPPVAIAPHRLTQSVLYLVRNAHDAIRTSRQRAAAADSGCIEVLARRRDDASVALVVKDDGCGMDADELARANRLLTSAASEPSTRLPTYEGLGLALTHAICERIGGSMAIESAPGQGTTVTLNLPVAQLVHDA